MISSNTSVCSANGSPRRRAHHDSDATSPMADRDSTTAALPDEMRCKYPGKFCGGARVRKSTGSLHRYCQYHRDKASTNQKRWTLERRQQAAQEDQQRRLEELMALGPPLMNGDDSGGVPMLLPDPVPIGHCSDPVDLSWEDTLILNALFIGESDMDSVLA